MITIGNSQILGKRSNQEDYFASRPYKDGYICVIADGMGGYEGGEVASALSVKTFLDYFEAHQNEPSIKKLFHDALTVANDVISTYTKSHPDKEGMGTTFIALLVYQNKLIWISVGDSIIYRYRQGFLERLNVDHSVAGELAQELLEGKITQQEYDNAPNKHMLTSALMGETIPFIDMPHDYIAVEEGDIIILSTDGIHTLSDDEIAVCVKSSEYEKVADFITDEVVRKNRSNQDNTTLITIKVEQEGEDQVVLENVPESKHSQGLTTPRVLIYALVLLLLVVTLYVSGLFDSSEEKLVDNNNTIHQIIPNVKENNTTSKSTDLNDVNESLRTDTNITITVIDKDICTPIKASSDTNTTVRDNNTSKAMGETNVSKVDKTKKKSTVINDPKKSKPKAASVKHQVKKELVQKIVPTQKEIEQGLF